jgi:oligoendopeptidase F
MENTQWKLSKYFYSSLEDPQIEKDKQEIHSQISSFVSKYKTQLHTLNTVNDWNEFFLLQEKFSYLITKIHFYYFYLTSLNTQDQQALKAEAEFEHWYTEHVSKPLLFIDEEFKSMGEHHLLELSKHKDLESYSYFFSQKAKSLQHQLSNEEEKLLLEFSSVMPSSSFVKLYEELTNSFQFPIEIDGKIKPCTSEEIFSYLQHPSQELRKKAYESMISVYSNPEHQIVLAHCYKNIAKSSAISHKLRKFSSVMGMRNLSEDHTEQTITTLMETVKESYPLYSQFLTLKAKLLYKKDTTENKNTSIKVYDIFAPLSLEKKEYSFDQAKEIVFSMAKQFDSEMYEYYKEMFEDSRVDVFPKQGKRGGAFCNYYKGFPSFVLLNYTSTLNDVSTLAHELGHAYHGYLSQQQPEIYFESPFSLAETASIFNELLLSDYLETTLSKEEKISFYLNQLQEVFATLYRQIQYTFFEKKAHEAFLEGRDLHYTELNALWKKEVDAMSLDAIDYEGFSYEVFWSRVPHLFLYPFYCYSYSFGQSLSFALFYEYQHNPSAFLPKYKQLLASGGSSSPKELLLSIFNLDIESKEFYLRAISVIKDRLKELEKII